MYGLATTLYEFMLEAALECCVLAQSENIIAKYFLYLNSLYWQCVPDSLLLPNMRRAYVRSACDRGRRISRFN